LTIDRRECHFFERPIIPETTVMLLDISKFSLKNVYYDYFDTTRNMTQVYRAKGNTMYYGYSAIDETYLEERAYSLEREAILEKHANDNNAEAIKPAGILWKWPMPGTREININ
jgi:hypothetical protein